MIMKSFISKMTALLLVLLLVLALGACEKKNTSSFGENAGDFNLDFGTEEQENGEETQSGEKAESGTDSKNTAKPSSGKVAVKNVETKKAAAGVTNADALSWKELAAQIPAAVKGKTIRVYSWNPAKEVTGAEKVIADFQKQTGIKVKWVVGGYEDYTDKVAAMINAGDAPDLIRMVCPDMGRVAVASDIRASTGYDYNGAIWDKRITDQYTFKGKLYAVNLKNTLVQQPRVVLYRKSVIETCKLEDPYALWKAGKWNWDKMLSMAAIYKEMYPNNHDPIMTYNHTDLCNMTGSPLISFDGSKYVNNIDNPNTVKQLREMIRLRTEGYTTEAARHIAYYESGKVLFMLFNGIAMRTTNANMLSVKKEDDLYAVPIPTLRSDNAYELSEAEAYAVPKGAKNGEAVYYFLRYYLDADNYDKSTYFANKQCAEVFDYCMTKKKFFTDITTLTLDRVSTGGNAAGLTDYIRFKGTAAQLNSQIDSLKPTFDLAVKKANELYEKLN